MSLTKEQMFADSAPVIESVDVPEMGGKVFVRMLTFSEQTAFEAECAVMDEGDTAGYMAASLAAYVCDEGGAPLTTIAEWREKLGTRKARAIARIMEAAQRLNRGLTPDAVEAAKQKS